MLNFISVTLFSFGIWTSSKKRFTYSISCADPINLYPKFSYSLIVLCASDNLTLTSIFSPPNEPMKQ